MTREIDLTALRQATDNIFRHVIDELGVTRVPITDDADFYWEVPPNCLFAVKQAQPQLDIGRLSDDYDFLANASKDPSVAVAMLFVHAAPLLRFVGEKVGK